MKFLFLLSLLLAPTAFAAEAGFDVLTCVSKIPAKPIHVKVFPFENKGAKCGANLEFYLDGKKIDGNWFCQNDSFQGTWSQIYSRPEGNEVLIYDPVQGGYEFANWRSDVAAFFPMDCQWGSSSGID